MEREGGWKEGLGGESWGNRGMGSLPSGGLDLMRSCYRVTVAGETCVRGADMF